ncbi:MAG: excinuclease ABC subunit UvrA [Candidatus Helarchaeota archaeon]
MRDRIIVKGAKQHNLKNINVEIPRDKLVVVTGISGSGKSSLVFDTIYAEGKRRYVESLSSYARQFLGQMDKPDVESIEGLSPAIAIQQRSLSRNPRSTVGTITEIHDYLRLLFARIGKPYCYKCGKKIERQTIQQIVDQILMFEGKRVYVMAPMVRGRKGSYKKLFQNLESQGYSRVRVDGEIMSLSEEINLEKNKKHYIDVVVDRLKINKDERSRLTDSCETAIKLGEGLISIYFVDDDRVEIFSEDFACPECGISFPELEPRIFSFNNPAGRCETCDGLGTTLEIDPLKVVDYSRSINDGAIPIIGDKYSRTIWFQTVEQVAKHFGINLDVPFGDLPKKFQDIILYGSNEIIKFNIGGNGRMQHIFERSYEGIIKSLERRYVETKSQYIRQEIQKMMKKEKCPSCGGDRLRIESRHVFINGKSICDLCKLMISELKQFIINLELNDDEKIIAKDILKELTNRIDFLLNVGLDYLTLERTADTLSVGEAQRIHLATQIGTNLMGVLYVLDEPTIGLHQRDNRRLINTLKKLRDIGNTVLVVEHDEEMIRSSDYIIEMGPGAGVYGGEVVVHGPLNEIIDNKKSITMNYLSGRKKIPIPKTRRKPNDKWIYIKGARKNNLKSIDVKIPLNVFTCITGVSGAGKSTLINDILLPALKRKLRHQQEPIDRDYDEIYGFEHIDKVISINQDPIGKTPRSNPATYTKIFDIIREIFSKLPESRMRGYKPGRFSFNVKGGRCEHCQGIGLLEIEMYFLPPVFIECPVCHGKRFNKSTLEIEFKGKNISDVLNMTVDEALEFFSEFKRLKRGLQTLKDVGLGYITLGQASPNLSGGESQRIKISRELSKKSTGNTLYILDEPTTGLSTYDISKLLDVLNRLIDAGNSVIVIEHNMDVIKSADYIIDLGPEGGNAGGTIVVEGPPEEIIKCETSYTGQFLKKYLSK